MIISISDVWDDAISSHRTYVKSVIDECLKVNSNKSITSPTLIDLLRNKWKVIAVGKPDDLENLISDVESILSGLSQADKDIFHTESKKVFDYKAFSGKDSKFWNAYKLCKRSKHSLCPYCQQAYAFTLLSRKNNNPSKKGNRGFRPTLDHYFAKSEYPYLGLSLYNLVPSCQTCNSSLKSTANFYYNKHLHPLRDTECLAFNFKAAEYVDYLKGNDTELKLKIKITDKSKKNQAKLSIETFLLNKRYKFHYNELSRWIDSLRRWTPDLIMQLSSKDGVLENTDDLEKILLNFDPKSYKYEMLGLIKRDIFEIIRSS